MTGDFAHILWDYPVLQGFWQDIKQRHSLKLRGTDQAAIFDKLGVVQRESVDRLSFLTSDGLNEYLHTSIIACIFLPIFSSIVNYSLHS